jgi:twitching motility protein PilT
VPQSEFMINKLFHLASKQGASDLYLRVGSAPLLRIDGLTRPQDMRPVTPEDLELLVLPLLYDEQRRRLQQQGTVVFTYELEEGVAYRVTVSREGTELGLSAHRLGAG